MKIRFIKELKDELSIWRGTCVVREYQIEKLKCEIEKLKELNENLKTENASIKQELEKSKCKIRRVKMEDIYKMFGEKVIIE